MTLTRRTALALSGAVAGTVAAASLAGALVIGGAGDGEPTPPDPIAVVDATTEVPSTASGSTTTPEVDVVYQDVYDLPPATAPAGGPGAPGLSPATAVPVASGDLSSAVADDDWDDDGEYDDDDHEDDEYDEYEEDDDDDHEEDDDHDDEGEWEDD